MARHAATEIERGGRLHHVTRHMLGLYHGQPARDWRRRLTAMASDRATGADALETLAAELATVMPVGPGSRRSRPLQTFNSTGSRVFMADGGGIRKLTLAQQADRHDLYEKSVQDPESECAFIANTFRKIRRRKPAVLREDFCGTAGVACEWVRQGPGRRAIGVDLDPSVLAWGVSRNLARLNPAQRRRVELLEDDVLGRTRRWTPSPPSISATGSSRRGPNFCATSGGRGAPRRRRIFFLDAYGAMTPTGSSRKRPSTRGSPTSGTRRILSGHRRDLLSHRLPLPGRFAAEAGIPLRLAVVVAAGAAGDPGRGRLCAQHRLVGGDR